MLEFLQERNVMRITICDDEKSVRDVVTDKERVLYPEADIFLCGSGEELLAAERVELLRGFCPRFAVCVLLMYFVTCRFIMAEIRNVCYTDMETGKRQADRNHTLTF